MLCNAFKREVIQTRSKYDLVAVEPLGKVLFQVSTRTPLARDGRGHNADDKQDERDGQQHAVHFRALIGEVRKEGVEVVHKALAGGEDGWCIVDAEGLRVVAIASPNSAIRSSFRACSCFSRSAWFCMSSTTRLGQCLIDLLVDGGEFRVVAGSDAREFLRLGVGR